MFQIYGEEITFEGKTIGHLSALLPTMQDRARDLLESATPDAVPLKEHEEAIKDMEREAFNSGKVEMREEMARELDLADEKGFDRGFDEGRKSAIADMERGKDLARVEALLQSVSEAHDALFPVTAQRHPMATASAVKTAAKICASELRRAVQAYRA